jgi:TRAP-type mannitol/chloroaromatic compound transport system permease small subunit
MPSFVVKYVRVVDYLSTRFGRIAMYLIFLMIGTLLLDAVTRNMLNIPLFWCVELAQFTLAAYYIMGGPYSMQLESHVRMDLLYDRLSERNKARMDSFTAIFLVVYLIVLLIGCISSTIYSIETNQRLFSMWNPSVVPIKLIMLFGIFLMLLQTLSTFFKDLAKARGLELA